MAFNERVGDEHVITEPVAATLNVGNELLLRTEVVATAVQPVIEFNTITEEMPELLATIEDPVFEPTIPEPLQLYVIPMLGVTVVDNTVVGAPHVND